MTALYLLLLIPFLSALLMLLVGGAKIAGYINVMVTAVNFVMSLFVAYYFLQYGSFVVMGQYFYIDAFNLLVIVLATFTAMTTAFFSNTYMWYNVTINQLSRNQLRLYHAMYQLFIFASLVVLTTNNLGILWVAIEGATLATVLLVGMYRTKEAVEAAWKYFILCIVGVALTLFGTVLIYFSSISVLPQIDTRLLWNVLVEHASTFDPNIIKIAFIFIMVGYGTKIGFVPLHNWLPDAYTECPAPVTVLLSGVLSNVSLYALIRFKILVDHALNNNLTGNLLIGFGLLSFVVGAAFLQRQRKLKRLFSYSSIEHLGLIAIAFGIGGKTATFIGLFYMLVHSLAKSAIFIIIGGIIQQVGTQLIEKIRGLIKINSELGWSLIIATLVMAAVPPFGIFTSELLLFIASVNFSPFLAVILIFGLIYALAGLLRNIQPVVYGEPITNITKKSFLIIPAYIHLGVVLILGLYIPPVLQQLLHAAVAVITR